MPSSLSAGSVLKFIFPFLSLKLPFTVSVFIPCFLQKNVWTQSSHTPLKVKYKWPQNKKIKFMLILMWLFLPSLLQISGCVGNDGKNFSLYDLICELPQINFYLTVWLRRRYWKENCILTLQQENGNEEFKYLIPHLSLMLHWFYNCY